MDNIDFTSTDPAARAGFLEHSALTAVQDLLDVGDLRLLTPATVQEIIDLAIELRSRVRQAQAEAA